MNLIRGELGPGSTDLEEFEGLVLHGMGKKQLRWEKEKKVVPLVEQSQEILAWLGKLSYQ